MDRGHRIAAQNVLMLRNSFQVVYVDALPVSTKVVDL
jgi:hypothetical protein